MTDDKTYFCPAFMRSDDPDVIAAIKARTAARDKWEEGVKAFVDKYDTSGKFLARIARGSLYFGGLAEKPNEGRWASEGIAYRPYKNDPRYAEWEALQVEEEELPGMPSLMILDDDDRSFFVSPFVFEHEGVAWAKASAGVARNPKGVPDPDVWVEVKASEWHAAREAFEEATR